jgi:Family of unknown function (DUF5677)
MDNPVFSQFVADAANIEESGRWAAMNKKIVSLAKNPGVGNAWQVQLLGGLCCQVFSEYRHLQDAREAERTNPSVLAWRARNLLELSVWSAYFSKSRENARRLYEDAGRDAKDVLDKFERWGQAAGQPVDWLSAIADSKNDLSRRAAGEGIESLDGRYMRVADAAGKCGLKDMFETMNKMLSKFAHPTAMQILGMADDDKQSRQRETFYALGCCFFHGAFCALEISVPFVRGPAQP